MRNVKAEVYKALEDANITEHLGDGYPKKAVQDETIVMYAEEQNSVYERVGNKESKTLLEYRIDIWDPESTSEAACKVDDAIAALGLVRTLCQDANGDPSGWKHKVMRYKGILDLDNDLIYWNI